LLKNRNKKSSFQKKNLKVLLIFLKLQKNVDFLKKYGNLNKKHLKKLLKYGYTIDLPSKLKMKIYTQVKAV